MRSAWRTALIAAAAVALPCFAQFPFGRHAPAGPWMNKSLSPDQRADLLIARMTLDEKISLLHGLGWGALLSPASGLPAHSLGGSAYIPAIPRLGIPALQINDAATGVARGAVFGRYSTALPSCIAEAASWDPHVAAEYGALIGRELRDQGYNMGLGGGIDLTREPRDGRTFEYQGEDPVLAGTMVGAEMKALGKQGVITHIKHYAMNDQENGRFFVNIRIGRRAMQETDLLAFEIAIKEGNIGAVMCSYNLVNGNYACENNYLLNDVLKKQWGFRGFVISDWGATHSTVKAANAGLDMEMPTSTYFGAALKQAVEDGKVSKARLDDMVHRLLRTEFAAGLFDEPSGMQSPNVFEGFKVAQKVEEDGSVLLKNADGQLPLSASSIHSIAVIGPHADVGVLSGGGSGQVDPAGGNAVPPPPNLSGLAAIFGVHVWHRSSPLEAIRAKAPDAKVMYNSGADVASAIALARNSDVSIVFVNQPSAENSDLATLELPGAQDALVESVAAANPHTIVVLETGGAVLMPWIDKVSAVLEAWYPGIRGGRAIAAILFGDVNPSAKLPITFPRAEADLPHPVVAQQPPARPSDMADMFPGIPFKVNTRRFNVAFDEGVKVGYRWYDAEHKPVLFPFGFGLSYTTYRYSGLEVASGGAPRVTFTVTNTGSRAGAEIAEIYATLPAAAGEPFNRLVAWKKVELAPGESKTVSLALDPHYLSIFNTDRNAWELLPGDYEIHAGASSRDLPLTATLHMDGTNR
jgi:beta-glucosidase